MSYYNPQKRVMICQYNHESNHLGDDRINFIDGAWIRYREVPSLLNHFSQLGLSFAFPVLHIVLIVRRQLLNNRIFLKGHFLDLYQLQHLAEFIILSGFFPFLQVSLFLLAFAGSVMLFFSWPF